MSENKIIDSLRQSVADFWQVEENIKGQDGQFVPYPLFKFTGLTAEGENKARGQEWLAASLERLMELYDYNESELSRQIALVFFRPAEWYSEYAWDYTLPDEERVRRAAYGEIIRHVMSTWLLLHPTGATSAMLTERIEILLRSPAVRQPPDLYPPTLADCLELLLADNSETATNLCSLIATGSLGRAAEGSVEEPELRRYAPALYNRLWQKERFNYPLFRQAMFALPNAFTDLSRPLDSVPPPDFYRDQPLDFALAIQGFYRALALELAEALPQDNAEAANLLKKVAVLQGAAWLLLACAYIESNNITSLPTINHWRKAKTPASAAVRLCLTQRLPADEENDTDTLNFLRQYQPATLLLVLPFARAYQDLICQALNWPPAWDLVQFLEDKTDVVDKTQLQKPLAQAILETFFRHRPSKRALITELRDNAKN